MGRSTLREEYFSWLYDLIKDRRYSYIKLASQLHHKTFEWSIRNDENRCEDGIALRDRFIDINHLDETHLEVKAMIDAPCTVLEVMVALAERMNDLMFDLSDTRSNKTPKFFHHMLVNLRLDRFVDNHNPDRRFSPVVEAEIDDILEVWLGRTYGYDGFGGLFPIKRRPPTDQSKVEIWYQVMAWLDENYG